MADLIGTQIAGYRVESLLSRGGMGEVYLAEQDAPRRKVALKLLAPELSEDPGFRERFARESEAAASIDHPNVIPIYQSGQADGALFIAMRYVEGTDLRSLLAEQGPLPPERAVAICAQIADALEAAHERGLVHRDVKPANILIGRNDHAYLSEFGLIRRSEVSTGITRTGQFMGTIDYVAPEQIRGEAVDGRADVYSLACVLYECLTGQPPFRRETEVATLYAHLEDPPPVPSARVLAVSPALDGVVAKAMAKVPDERFATAEGLGAAIRRSAEPEVVTAPAKPFPEQRRRRRFVAAIAGTAIVVVVAIVALVAGGGNEAPEDEPAAALPPLNSVIRVEAESGAVVSTVRGIPSDGQSLPQVEVGEGAVWVLAGSNLAHVDPSTEQIVGTTTFGGSFGTAKDALAVWSRTVWVAAPPGIVRINPATDQALRSVRLEGGSASTYIAAGGQNLWAVNGSDLTRVDALGRRVDAADLGQGSSGIGVGLDAVWIVDDLQGTLSRVDPDSLDVTGSTTVAGDIDAIAVGAGHVWIVDSTAGVVTPFDPTSLDAGSPVRVGEHPTDIAIGLGAVWVTDQGGGTISRIDPVTSSVDKIAIGAPVASLAVDEATRSLWVAIAKVTYI